MNDELKTLRERYEPQEFKVVTAEPQVVSARFSLCGKFLVAGGFDARVRRWNLETDEIQERPALAGHQGWVTALAFGPGDRLFTADSWGQIRAWPCSAEAAEPAWAVINAHDG